MTMLKQCIESLDLIISLQLGQEEWESNHISIQTTWKRWLHFGSNFMLSPSQNSAKQMAQLESNDGGVDSAEWVLKIDVGVSLYFRQALMNWREMMKFHLICMIAFFNVFLGTDSSDKSRENQSILTLNIFDMSSSKNLSNSTEACLPKWACVFDNSNVCREHYIYMYICVFVCLTYCAERKKRALDLAKYSKLSNVEGFTRCQRECKLSRHVEHS
jgi:hypothetical protein